MGSSSNTYTAIASIQAALWAVAMWLSQLSCSSAPVSVAPTLGYFPVLLLGAAIFVTIGVATDRAIASCDDEALRGNPATRVQAAVAGLVLPLLVVIPFANGWPTQAILFVGALGLPLAGLSAAIDRWAQVLWRNRRTPDSAPQRKAASLALLATLLWLLVPAGPFIGELFTDRHYP